MHPASTARTMRQKGRRQAERPVSGILLSGLPVEWALGEEEARRGPASPASASATASLKDRRVSMADNRGVAYLGPGHVEVQSIDFPKLELQDGPGVHPD